MQNSALTFPRKARALALFSAGFAGLFCALPPLASAGLIAPDSGQSPTAESVSLQYIVVAVIGLLTLLAVVASLVRTVKSAGVKSADVKSADVKSADPSDDPADDGSLKLVIGAAALVAAALAVLGGITYGAAASADPSKSDAPSGYKATPLADPTLKIAHEVEPPKGSSISVQVNGQQYLWRYTYLGETPVYSYHDLVIPVGVTVLLDVTSSDVTHGWWVPQLGGSIEAMPGYLNKGWIRADKAGTFKGASTVVSGTNYPQMTTRVVAMPPAKFDAWLKNKAAEIKNAGEELAKSTQLQESLQQGEAGQTQLEGVRGDIGGPGE